ncbi:hypothetical protein AaE_006003 [Aphanomyces astaci]|uniref:Myotubularin phosphatase domain-containing protein n=1 Tax=Aphanomyces astaci TaxID=112090 RepID=A0A6A5A160_APHAT|nr:hypothetical protein AaE_006003 [Aphanomyces astaci]
MSIPSPYMLSGRKKSSSFSDLGDYDECSDIGTPEKPGMFKPPPIHEEMMDTAFRLNDPTQDRASLIDSGITFLAGEVLKLRVDNVAYIVFYKPDASTGVIPNTGGDSSPSFNPMVSTDVSPPSPVDLASSIMTYDSSSGMTAPPKSFGAMGAAGHKVLTTDCFQRYSSTRGGTLGRGLFRASTHVGSALVKGTSTLISQTYEGGARGGVFGFAKGLGLGVWGFGSHTVKGAFRSVGHMTNVVGEMVLGMDPHFSLDGMLILTNYRLVWTSTAGDMLNIPLASVVNMETAVTASHVLLLECKNLLRPKFAFADDSIAASVIDAALALYTSGSYSFSNVHFEAIRSGACLEDVDGQEASSVDLYDPIADYTRLGLVDDTDESLWQLVDNFEYRLFPTYPHTFVVPSGLTHDDLVELSAYRSAARVPAVCQPNAHGTPVNPDALSRTLWLQHLSSIMFTASSVSQLLCGGESVMVHCSDGWDRTSQVAGLLEVMLDPYYRTLRGFLELMDKEWCSFGHMFRWRGGAGDSPNAQELEEQSPVFVQWLDAMWQLWRQVPWAFEFSDELLTTVYSHVYSGLFGTFQYNSEREKRAKEVHAPTRSLWRYLLSRQHEFVNVQYNARQSLALRGRPLPVLALESDLMLWDAHIACADPICRKYT